MSNQILVSLADQINAEHLAAVTHAHKAIGHARRCGQLLIEKKAKVDHGEWLPWLESHFRGSARTATAYMRVATNWDEIEAKSAESTDLSIDGALKLLRGPEPQRQLTVTKNLADPIQLYLRAGAINEGHAWQLFRLEETYGDLVADFSHWKDLEDFDFRKSDDVFWLLFCELRPEDDPICWFCGGDTAVSDTLAAGCEALVELVRQQDYKVLQWTAAAFWWASVVVYDPQVTPIVLADKLTQWNERFASAVFHMKLNRECPTFEESEETKDLHRMRLFEWWGYYCDVERSKALPIIDDPQDEKLLLVSHWIGQMGYKVSPSSCQPWALTGGDYKELAERIRMLGGQDEEEDE